MSAPRYVMRAAGPDDLEGFKQLREIAGAGFTSLMLDDNAMATKLESSRVSFAASVSKPGTERYFIALEHVESGALAGCCGVKATIGETPPFYNFRVVHVAQSSAAAQRRFDLDLLLLVNDFTGCTEVGSLFVRPEHRAGGVGRLLAQARYMLMAADARRFSPTVVSELRGVVDASGRSPFWEHLGRHFFRMDFEDADRLSASTDNQFILDLMPKYPIYVDLLPDAARAVIGQCHAQGEGALKLLQWEGFRYERVIDIFDGGPLVTAPRDNIRTFREARRLPLYAGAGGKRGLVAKNSIADFACVGALVDVREGAAYAPADVLAALGLNAGETALIWSGDGG
jgi:arginine N-succinyltransferase